MSVSPPAKVSVLLSVFNNGDYVRAAIQSVLEQTFGDFELIIVDDGSKDNSAEIIKTHASADPRIRVIRHANQGLTASLNIGLRAANAEFIARMDGDDICHPRRLEKQLQAFQRDPDLVLVGSEVELIDAQGREVGPRGHKLEHAEIRRQLLTGNGGAMTHPAVMFRRSVAEEVGGYDERFLNSQDLDLFLRLSECGAVCNLPESLLYWRQHAKSINHTQAHLWKQMRVLALFKTIERIGAEAFFDQSIPESTKLHHTGDKFFLKNSLKAGRYPSFSYYLSVIPNHSFLRRLSLRIHYIRRHGLASLWHTK